MKLEEIGFYTLSDARAKNISVDSPLWRCELILTDRCNFNCPYCRGVKSEYSGDLDFEVAKRTVDLWCADNLQNIRFSGGEPTLYPQLDLLVKRAAAGGVKNIAISTNGSAPFGVYEYLISLGANDFSISLDSCCSSTGRTMAGGIDNVWEKVVENIEKLSKLTYVTVGVVLTDTNVNEVVDTIRFADKLGVSDIRIISAAQDNRMIDYLATVDSDILDRNPILRYRARNYRIGRNVRGLTKDDCHSCFLMLDDMAVLSGKHFPCIIYMREGGNPVGDVGPDMRRERLKWVMDVDTHKDPICSQNCLDVCIDFNNRVRELMS